MPYNLYDAGNLIIPIRDHAEYKLRSIHYQNRIMTKSSYQKPSQQTQEEALKIARGTQRPAQTKEQTRLIAQGIQKGIDLYKKQQKEKARDASRKLKKISSQKGQSTASDDYEIAERIVYRQHWLPWLLLILTWLGVGIYFLV